MDRIDVLLKYIDTLTKISQEVSDNVSEYLHIGKNLQVGDITFDQWELSILGDFSRKWATKGLTNDVFVHLMLEDNGYTSVDGKLESLPYSVNYVDVDGTPIANPLARALCKILILSYIKKDDQFPTPLSDYSLNISLISEYPVVKMKYAIDNGSLKDLFTDPLVGDWISRLTSDIIDRQEVVNSFPYIYTSKSIYIRNDSTNIPNRTEYDSIIRVSPLMNATSGEPLMLGGDRLKISFESTQLGRNLIADNENTYAFNYNNIAIGKNAIVFNSDNIAIGNNVSVFGTGNVSSSVYEFSVIATDICDNTNGECTLDESILTLKLSSDIISTNVNDVVALFSINGANPYIIYKAIAMDSNGRTLKVRIIGTHNLVLGSMGKCALYTRTLAKSVFGQFNNPRIDSVYEVGIGSSVSDRISGIYANDDSSLLFGKYSTSVSNEYLAITSSDIRISARNASDVATLKLQLNSAGLTLENLDTSVVINDGMEQSVVGGTTISYGSSVIIGNSTRNDLALSANWSFITPSKKLVLKSSADINISSIGYLTISTDDFQMTVENIAIGTQVPGLSASTSASLLISNHDNITIMSANDLMMNNSRALSVTGSTDVNLTAKDLEIETVTFNTSSDMYTKQLRNYCKNPYSGGAHHTNDPTNINTSGFFYLYKTTGGNDSFYANSTPYLIFSNRYKSSSFSSLYTREFTLARNVADLSSRIKYKTTTHSGHLAWYEDVQEIGISRNVYMQNFAMSYGPSGQWLFGTTDYTKLPINIDNFVNTNNVVTSINTASIKFLNSQHLVHSFTNYNFSKFGNTISFNVSFTIAGGVDGGIFADDGITDIKSWVILYRNPALFPLDQTGITFLETFYTKTENTEHPGYKLKILPIVNSTGMVEGAAFYIYRIDGVSVSEDTNVYTDGTRNANITFTGTYFSNNKISI